MRLLFLAVFLIVNLLGAKHCNAQGTGTFQWTNGAPNNNPGLSGAKFAVDKNSYRWYEWTNGTNWVQCGDRIQQISGCAAPAYTPTIHNAYFVVNGCTNPEFYYWNGTAWKLLNGGGGAIYTAGTGIAISGSNVISNTLPNANQTISTTGEAGNITLSNGGGTLNLNVNDADSSPTNELQNLSLTGQNLALSNGGGNVSLPLGGIYGGSGNIPANTVANSIQSFSIQGFDGSNYADSDNKQKYESIFSPPQIEHSFFDEKVGTSSSFFRISADGKFDIITIVSNNSKSCTFSADGSAYYVLGSQLDRDGASQGYSFVNDPENGIVISTNKANGTSNINANVGEISLYTEVNDEAINGRYGLNRLKDNTFIDVHVPFGSGGLLYDNDNTDQIKGIPNAIPSVQTVNILKTYSSVWDNSTRPTPAGGEYPWGFNTDTGKHEGWDGTNWNSFY